MKKYEERNILELVKIIALMLGIIHFVHAGLAIAGVFEPSSFTVVIMHLTIGILLLFTANTL